MRKDHFRWDNFSDQPHIILDKKLKRSVRLKYLYDYIKLLLTSLVILPISLLLIYFFKTKKRENGRSFYGIGVNLDKGSNQQELIEELGVENLLIRIPLSDIKNLDLYYEFAKSFTCKTPKNIALNIMQDRENIENLELFEKNLSMVFKRFDGFVTEYQIATTTNRLKWGFFAPKEYLELFQVAYRLKQKHFPDLKLIGPSVIDFEYHYTARMLFNNYSFKFDITNALLYVDRRGSPTNKQALIFDLKKKIDLLYSMTKLSPKSEANIYISETNWPLSNTAPYAPTSEKECVDNASYTKYMLSYHKIAKKSGKIKRVYWHQLIAPGYGLVDNRDAKIVKLPQFYAYKKMVRKGSFES